ncbi:MAG TPA: TIGR02302 family protein [Pseudolabrys sp.]|nr:TIGR02302 family protein [Pseudolabrys sp.]
MDTLDPHQHSPGDQPIRRLLERALQRARGSIFWERLWPALVAVAVVGGLFLAFSWAGLWLLLPPLGRAIGLFLFLVVALAAAVPLALLRIPTINEGLRRLDRGSGERHRPATAIADEIAGNPNDPVTQALWRAHVERALLSARKLKAGWPKPYLSARDPMALRALVLILVVATFFAAGGERIKRITAAFDWHGVVAPANFRIDAWVNPPLYTGRPPIMLSGLRSGEAAQEQTGAIAVPVGSELVVRGTGQVRFDVVAKGGLEDAKADKHQPASKGAVERRLVIKGNGSATLQGAGTDLVWNFTAIPDKAPTIDLIRDPERQARGSLRLDYRVTDDYGVTQAQATFARKDQPAEGSQPPHPLFKAPEFALSLPGSRARAGTAQTTHDLTSHPWAGADVTMTLIARDEAGNVGRSKPHELTLPERIFTKPVARALIEQRRNLALDANTKPIVLTALDALTLAPEKFTPNLSVYLGLRSIYFDLLHAKSDDALRDVVARMWDMAVQIEDGNMSQTEQALRQAQEALRQALERNAPDEEIRRLMEQLRAALDKFLQSLAEQMKRNPQQLARPLDRNTRVLSERDLQNLIDRMENLARSGNKEAARRLLDQLQSMLENLQMAQPNMGQQGDDDMMSALDELGDMIRKQQQLRDRTFKQGQDSRRNQQPGQRRQFGDLQRDQQQLHQRLQQLLEQLRKNGLGQMPGQKGQGQKGQKGQNGQNGQGQNEMGELGDAGEAMGEAEGQLGQGDADNAVDSQGRALEAMRKGAQGLAQQMQQSGMGPGPGQPGRGRPRAQQDTDPLGRPMRGRQYGDDLTVKVPGEIDAQRARRILEELRKRLADPSRPQMELDYIERLLQGF